MINPGNLSDREILEKLLDIVNQNHALVSNLSKSMPFCAVISEPIGVRMPPRSFPDSDAARCLRVNWSGRSKSASTPVSSGSESVANSFRMQLVKTP